VSHYIIWGIGDWGLGNGKRLLDSLEHRFTNKNLTPQPPSHLSLALPYKGREKEKLLFLEGGERMPLLDAGRGSSRITESMF
jgi:hypothetical protein